MESGSTLSQIQSSILSMCCLPPALLKPMVKPVLLAAAAAAVVGAWPARLQPLCCAGSRDASAAPSALRDGAAGLSATDGPPQWAARAVCIGVGGGALPLFLSHHFPGLLVDAVRLNKGDFILLR